MGIIIEFYTLTPSGGMSDAGIDQATARELGRQAATISINSAAFAVYQAWLIRTPLAPMFENPSNADTGIYFPLEQISKLASKFPLEPETQDFMLALESAVEEAMWEERGLWIGES